MSEQHQVDSYDAGLPRAAQQPSLTGNALAARVAPFQWRPGASGNPSGRSKRFHEVQEAARDNSVSAINKLAGMIDSDDERVAIIACNSILDRAFGKPKEQKTEDNQSVKPSLGALSPLQLAQFRAIMQTLAQAATSTDSTQDVAPSMNVAESKE